MRELARFSQLQDAVFGERTGQVAAAANRSELSECRSESIRHTRQESRQQDLVE